MTEQVVKPASTRDKLIAVSIVGAIALYFVGGMAYNRFKADAEAALPVTKVTMIDLEKAFEANEVAALRNYSSHRLLISGEVVGILLDAEDNVVINIAGSGILPVGVNLPEYDRKAAAGLSQGDIVTVSCTSVAEMMAKPVLDGCRLSSP